MSGFLLHLMRHGAPERPGLLLGHRDDAPLPGGVARCLANAEGLEFAQVISSDLTRALVPARRIAAVRGLAPAVDRRWRELDFGDWTGLAPAEVDPAAHARFWDDPEAHAPPGGERWSQLRARIAEALAELDAPSLVVAHAGAMRAALSVLFHMEHRQVWAFDLPCSCVLSLRVWPGEAAQIVGLSA
ncbi:MAG TPA: histidine phosphatase family protein [Novosphingobium sp.]|nr:histidine phosphatase family protein [Novosphingobium sp.]